MRPVYPGRIFIVLLLLLIEFANGFRKLPFQQRDVNNEMENIPLKSHARLPIESFWAFSQCFLSDRIYVKTCKSFKTLSTDTMTLL